MNFNDEHKTSQEKFSFDDILLVPSYAKSGDGEVEGILDCELFGHKMTFPFLSSPMDTITEFFMMDAMLKSGGVGVHHRYDIEKFTSTLGKIEWGGFAVSPSMGVDAVSKMGNQFSDYFYAVDVSHGDSEKIYNFCKNIISNGVRNIVSGNICAPDAAERYLKIGINHLRLGVGGGSRCSTRTVSGFGFPQGSCVYEIRQEFPEAIIISDGGVKNTGDCAKSFSLGADLIMSGFLFAGTDECPKIDGKSIYRGMASKEALEGRKKEFFVEGESTEIEPKGSVTDVILKIKDALKASCYYGGVSHYKDLRSVEKILITQSSYFEGLTRK